ncbi:MAG: succinate dehydrogenase/fumarate reductase iron-sulfur subunit [Castellaniella sp.]|uniref:succinate dehydrogenase/fumarate reductase iron-sulfur subunit n=1 Tax=Castellaniella sp. TaxID=1955812 RepID=UPI003A9157FB
MNASHLRAKVWRGTENGDFVTYDVPRNESQTVLDVVTYIQRHLDSTLSYRFSCRVGMCGSCAMNVNGIARWTCRTHVSKVLKGDVLEIAPLSNLPVIKDLATDMKVFFDKWARAMGQFHGSKTRHDEFALVDPASKERVAAADGTECIGCGVCYSSCDVVTWLPDFLGPAALNRSWTLMNDIRDVKHAERLEVVAGDAGCHSCHTQGSCTERCPKHIAPSFSIAGLKQLTVTEAIWGKKS